MAPVRVNKVRLIDWIDCFLGLISCDFNNEFGSNAVAPLSYPVTPAYVHHPQAVKPFETCGGSTDVVSLTIEGCDDSAAPCVLPYGETAKLSLTYTPKEDSAMSSSQTSQREFNVAGQDRNGQRKSLHGIEQASNNHYKRSTDAGSPTTLTYEVQFGEDTIGEEITVKIELGGEDELVACAATGVTVVDKSQHNAAAPAHLSSAPVGGKIQQNRLQQPIEEDL